MWGGNQHHRLASTDRRADRFIPFFCAWPQVCFVNPDANLLSFQVGSQADDELLVSMRVGEKDKHLRLIHSWLPSRFLQSRRGASERDTDGALTEARLFNSLYSTMDVVVCQQA